MARYAPIGPREWFIAADHRLVVPVDDGDCDNPTPLDMAGWTFQLVVREGHQPGGDVVIDVSSPGDFTLSTNADGTAAGVANNVVTVALPGALTVGLNARAKYGYALWRTDDPSDQPLVYGEVIFTAVPAQAV